LAKERSRLRVFGLVLLVIAATVVASFAIGYAIGMSLL
jgi:hypothetical protein